MIPERNVRTCLSFFEDFIDNKYSRSGLAQYMKVTDQAIYRKVRAASFKISEMSLLYKEMGYKMSIHVKERIEHPAGTCDYSRYKGFTAGFRCEYLSFFQEYFQEKGYSSLDITNIYGNSLLQKLYRIIRADDCYYKTLIELAEIMGLDIYVDITQDGIDINHMSPNNIHHVVTVREVVEIGTKLE